LRKLRTVPNLLLLPVVALVALAAAAVPPPNLDRALEGQRALVQRQPTAEAWNDLGNLLELASDAAGARDAYGKALALDPKLASAHYNLGLLLRGAGEGRKAMDEFREVVELAPDDGWACFQIGALLEARGSESAAVDAYARAFALDPKLSFGDVNPQVIDSKLTTQSLLRAQEERPATTDAARAYEDPRHIRKLLLPQVPAGAPAVAAAPHAPAVAAPTTPQGRRSAPPAGATGPGDSKVLGPEDLRAGRAGGITNPNRPPQPGEFAARPNEPGYSDLLRQQLELQQQQQQEIENGEGGEVAPEVPAGVYVPGVRSSGQISQVLGDLGG
jgi:tetratricopeptide (TPR) repeat protein